MRKAVLMLSLAVACGGSGGIDGDHADVPQERVAPILRGLDAAMFECPDRAWPGTEDIFRGNQILLVSHTDGIGYLWNDRRAGVGEPPRTTTLGRHELSPEWFEGTLPTGEIDGVPTLGLSLEDGQLLDDEVDAKGLHRWHDVTLHLAFHESFHIMTDQNEWPVTEIPRPTPYPEDAAPRYLRAALIQALVSARDIGPDSARAAAAYWQARLLAEHGDEMDAIRAVDVLEGTAQHVEATKSGIAAYGCDAADAEIAAGIYEHADFFHATSTFNPLKEPYGLGASAGVLLQSVPGWQERAEGGETPVDILVDGVAPVDQTDDPSLIEAAQQAVDARNAERAVQLAPLLDLLPRTDVTRIPIEASCLTSFESTEQLRLVEQPDRPVAALEFTATCALPAEIRVSGVAVLVDVENPCHDEFSGFVAIVSDAALSQAGGRYTSTDDAVEFASLPAEEKTDRAGRRWLCPTAD